MTYNLISNSRPGRKAEVIHIAGLNCPALARAKYIRDMGNNGSDDLGEALRGASAIAAAFLPVTVCRKCRSAARRHMQAAGKRVSPKRERILSRLEDSNRDELRVTKSLALDNYQRTRNMRWAREARGIDAYLAGDRKGAVKLLIAAGW